MPRCSTIPSLASVWLIMGAPSFMVSNSVDNFWLITAMRYGIPAFVLMLGTYLW